MNLAKISALAVVVLLSLTKTVNANSIEFFSSNNTAEITPQVAYQRLASNEQQKLHNAIFDVLKKNHVEEGKTENVLGAYMMADDHNVTADNTEAVQVKNHKLPKAKAFMIAQELAVKLKQESVAVFIPVA